ncbi:MAG: GNAT family N-acetyltransferase [Caldilineaceae bacterium]|nr:GNAT family N-acetyltransferase [Caldilineaceae bacterium]MDE0079942.1 GNAT family N-acetyltransferase [Caldilineaceae bacterium]
MTVHPAHDDLVREVRSWYICDFPALGKVVARSRFGYYSRIQHTDYRDIHILEPFDHAEAPAFIADVRAFYGRRRVHIFTHGQAVDAQLSHALEQAGCARGAGNLYLAHVNTGQPPKAESGPGRIEPVTPGNLRDYSVTKLKGFAGSEEEPDPAAVEADMAVRRAELDAGGAFLIARLGGEAAAIIGFYEGPDRYIFNLATRAPFRHQGIARQLLSRVLADTYAQNKRSLLINTDPDDTPVQFYRRIGFVDEIYWMRKWLWEGPSSR